MSTEPEPNDDGLTVPLDVPEPLPSLPPAAEAVEPPVEATEPMPEFIEPPAPSIPRRVRAIAPGYYGEFYRNTGDTFEINGDPRTFSKKWMELV